MVEKKLLMLILNWVEQGLQFGFQLNNKELLIMKIGIIDDDSKLAESISVIFNMWFEKSAITSANAIFRLPNVDIDANINWINEEDICVLILDEKLMLGQNGSVTYAGHELVERIRRRIPDLPIFILTGFSIEESLRNSESSIEYILSKNDFTDNAEEREKWISRIVRAGNSFYSSRQSLLTKLTRLAEKIALGTASDEEVLRIAEIREQIGIAHWSESLSNKYYQVLKLEELCEKANELTVQIYEMLKMEGF
jgi:DNA-binding NarL/FixJ family response regulator